ncbi:hypothetical protein FRB99_007542 [Tulasnella sp. 403]|nr:hypothetical protein FRB99_007542 [Tulasnella sp. 403]
MHRLLSSLGSMSDLKETVRDHSSTNITSMTDCSPPLVEEPLPVSHYGSRSSTPVSLLERHPTPATKYHRVDNGAVIRHTRSGSFKQLSEFYERVKRKFSDDRSRIKLTNGLVVMSPSQPTGVSEAYDLFCAEDTSNRQKIALKRFRLTDSKHADQQRQLRDVADGLQHLHASQIVHGDVRPQNVLVCGDGRAIIKDAGFAELVPSSASGGPQRLDALRFQGPELYNGDSCSFQSDTYSFGLTIYQVLSEKTPFEKYKTVGSLLEAVATRGERPTKDLEASSNPEPYATLWTVAGMCWDADPKKRPPMSEGSHTD